MIDQAFEEWYDPAFKEEKIAISFIKYLKSKIEARIKELEKEYNKTLKKNYPDMECENIMGRIAELKRILGDEK